MDDTLTTDPSELEQIKSTSDPHSPMIQECGVIIYIHQNINVEESNSSDEININIDYLPHLFPQKEAESDQEYHVYFASAKLVGELRSMKWAPDTHDIDRIDFLVRDKLCTGPGTHFYDEEYNHAELDIHDYRIEAMPINWKRVKELSRKRRPDE